MSSAPSYTWCFKGSLKKTTIPGQSYKVVWWVKRENSSLPPWAISLHPEAHDLITPCLAWKVGFGHSIIQSLLKIRGILFDSVTSRGYECHRPGHAVWAKCSFCFKLTCFSLWCMPCCFHVLGWVERRLAPPLHPCNLKNCILNSLLSMACFSFWQFYFIRKPLLFLLLVLLFQYIFSCF